MECLPDLKHPPVQGVGEGYHRQLDDLILFKIESGSLNVDDNC